MSATETLSLVDRLTALGACADAVQWAKNYPTLAEAWTACDRGDWLLWLVGRTVGRKRDSAGRKRVVLAACACARLALIHVRPGEDRPRLAIETAERWAQGDPAVSLADVRAAAAAAYAAAAYAAYAAADAAAYAAYAAYAAAAYAAYAAGAAYAARAQTLSVCADLVRARFTPAEIEEAWT